MKKIIYLLFILVFRLTLSAQEIDTTLWTTDNPVSAVARVGNTIYIGGTFTQVGPNLGHVIEVDKISGKLTEKIFPHVNGYVSKFIPDGKGGWYIIGNFTSIAHISRKGVAHILPNYSLDMEWAPDLGAFNTIHDIVLNDTEVYVVGIVPNAYYNIFISTINRITGQSEEWITETKIINGSNIKNTLALKGDTLFIGGLFQKSIPNYDNISLCAFIPKKKQILDWQPPITGPVNKILISGDKMFVGGDMIVGNAIPDNFYKNKLLQINLNNLSVQSLELTGNAFPSAILDMTISGDTLIVGGYSDRDIFASPPNPKISLVKLSTKTVYTPAIYFDSYAMVSDVVFWDNTIYFSGYFDKVNSVKRDKKGAFHLQTGLTDWQPAVATGINFTESDNGILISGQFTTLGEKRNGLAALDAITGKLLEWNPNLSSNNSGVTTSGSVSTITSSKSGDIIYVSGAFTSVNGQIRNNFAAFETRTGNLTSWNPPKISGAPYGEVSPFIKDNYMYYLTNSVNKINLSDGSIESWYMAPNAYIIDMIPYGDTLFVYGYFSEIGGQPRKNFAAFRISDQKLLDWELKTNFSAPSGYISDRIKMCISGNTIFVGDIFDDNIGGKIVAGFDLKSGKSNGWQYILKTRRFFNMAVADNKLYVYTSEEDGPNNVLNPKITAFNLTTPSIIKEWSFEGMLNNLTPFGKVLYFGGNFTLDAVKSYSYLAAIGKDSVEVTVTDKPNQIKGTIFIDKNNNCIKDKDEIPLPNISIKVTPGYYYTITDFNGDYTISIDTGTFIIEPILSQVKNKQINPVCNSSQQVSFKSYNNIVYDKNFAVEIISLPFLETTITSNRHRRCFANSTTINYTNSGSAKSENAKVYVKLPEYVIFKSADKPFTRDKEGNYVFDVGILQPNQSGTINIVDSVACKSGITGLTQCTKVWITPSNQRNINPSWDKSDIFLSGKCQDNGFVRMGIYNKGSGNMKDSLEYRIFINAQLSLRKKFKLNQNDSLIFRIPANGRTIRLEADEPKEHPSKLSTNLTMENCGTSPNTPPSLGYVTKLPQDDTEPEVAINCLPIVDSYDPNDKGVEPEGTTSQHYTPTDIELKYLVRFQNTGTDTAYTVTVIDTLSENLDIATLQLGSSSHKYSFNLSGKGKPVLTWTFNNINLPDSTKNSLASNGFVAFSIKPKTGLAQKTRIENYADIIFDFNDPVRTNTTFNTIYDVPLTVDNAVKLDEKAVIIPKPVITSFSPAKAKIGESITLKGKYFDKTLNNNTVKLNNLNATLDSGNDSTLVFKVPSGTTTGKISVENTAGSVSSTADLIILLPPVISSFSPQTGVPGDKVTITGTGFDAVKENNIVRFGTVSAEVISATATSLEVKVPGGFVAEKIAVSTSVGNAISTASFTMAPNALEIIGSENISIFPNPTDGKVYINFGEKGMHIREISILNMLGVNILNKKIEKLTLGEEINLEGKSSGVYLIIIKTQNATFTKKLVLK